MHDSSYIIYLPLVLFLGYFQLLSHWRKTLGLRHLLRKPKIYIDRERYEEALLRSSNLPALGQWTSTNAFLIFRSYFQAEGLEDSTSEQAEAKFWSASITRLEKTMPLQNQFRLGSLC